MRKTQIYTYESLSYQVLLKFTFEIFEEFYIGIILGNYILFFLYCNEILGYYYNS